MTGKVSFIIFYILFCTSFSYGTYIKTAELKGALLYEKDIDKPVIVNPKYVLYHRNVNLDDIYEAANVLQKFTDTYSSFCSEIDKVIDTDFVHVYVPNYDPENTYFVSETRNQIQTAPSICANEGYDLVEVRTLTDYNMLKELTKKHNMSYIYAGVHWNNNTNRLQYLSDMTQASTVFDELWYTIAKDEKLNSQFWDPLTFQWWNKARRAIYDFSNNQRSMILLQGTVGKRLEKIVCQKYSSTAMDRKHNDFLLKITQHVCNRDLDNMKKMVDLMVREISLFRLIEQPQHDEPKPIISIAKCPIYNCQNCKYIPIIIKKLQDFSARYAQELGLPRATVEKYLIFRALDYENMYEFSKFTQYNFSIPITPSKNSTFDVSTEQLAFTIVCNLHHDFFTNKNIDKQEFSKEHSYSIRTVVIEIKALLLKTITPIKVKRYASYKQKGSAAFTALEPISFSNWEYWIFSAYHLEDFTNMHKAVKQNAHALADLHINQHELKVAYQNLQRELTMMKNISRIQEYAISTLFAEFDTKQATNNLYNIIQNSLIKLATALSDAKDNKISPFVLSPTELDRIATAHRKQEVLLSSNIGDVEVNLYRSDKNFMFSFAIPIIDNSKLFRIYSIRNFPLFSQTNDMGTIQKDADYIGISVDTTHYIELTQTEYYNCIENSFCKISGISAPINKQAKCTAQTFRYNRLLCDIVKTKETTPFFATYGNITYYSVPANYGGNIICPNLKSTQHHEAVTGALLISGVGSFQLQKSCFVQLPDDRKIYNHNNPDAASTDLGIPTLLEALRYAPNADQFTFNITPPVLWNHSIPEVTLLDVQIKSLEDLVTYTLKPQVVFPQLLIGLIIFLCIAIPLGLFFCCNKRARAWFMAWSWIRNPKKYWTKYKNYKVPGFDKIPKFDQRADEQTRQKLSLDYLTYLFRFKRDETYRVNPPNPKYELQDLVQTRRDICEAALKPSAPAVIMSNPASLYPQVVNFTPNNEPAAKKFKPNTYVSNQSPDDDLVHKTVKFDDQVQEEWREQLNKANLNQQ